jgi:tetratricopeptide (TPR) repeat protein
MCCTKARTVQSTKLHFGSLTRIRARFRAARRAHFAACVVALSAVAPHAFAQTPDNAFDQTIDDDLETQAQYERDHGHRERALALFNELVKRDTRRAGALLDTALLYCQLGERDLSLQTLTRIETQYEVPATIEKLIAFYKGNACAPPASRPSLTVSVGAGVTSNANFGPSSPLVNFAPGAPFDSPLAPASLAHSDQYVESAVQGELPIAAMPEFALLAGLSDRQYRSLHDFDQRTATFGIAHQKTFTQGELDNQLTTDVLWLGTHVYQRDFAWHVGYWSPPTTLRSILARSGLDFTVTDESYPGDSLYDSVHVELRASLQAHLGDNATMQLFVGPTWDKPYNDRPGGMRHGYTAWLGLDYAMGRYGQLETILQQRTLNDVAPYDPIFFGATTQRQTVRAASLRYSYPLGHKWSVYAQVSAQRISDTISLFAYTVRDGSVGLSWKY